MPQIGRQTIETLLARVGREELLPRLQRVSAQSKLDGSLVTEADLAVHRRVRRSLLAAWPDIPVLSEEMPAVEQQALLAGGGPLWCLDPLDGTSNFVATLPLFAVSLALIEDARITLGVVYDPIRDESFAATVGGGTSLNAHPLAPRRDAPALQGCIALVDFKRLAKPLAERLSTHPPYASQRNLGACALEWAWLAAGRGHLYLHGGMGLWDYAAGSLLLAEAGGFSATLDGEPVLRLDPGPRSAVAAVDQDLYVAWQRALSEAATH